MKRFFRFKRYYWEIALLLLFGIIPFLWFKDGFLAAGHDMSYPLAPIDFWLDRLFVWTDRIGSFGSNQTDAIPGIFIHGLQALFYFLTGDLQLAQKLDFSFWFALPGVTMYMLLRSLHPEEENFLLRISGSLFYMLNHFLLQAWIIAEMSKFSIYAALPLVVLAIINVSFRKGSILKNSILVGLTLFFLNGGAGIPLWGGLALTVVTALIVALLVSPQPVLRKLKIALGFSFLSLSFVILLNLYWIYPYVSSFKLNYVQRLEVAGGSEGSIAWSREISKNASFTNLIKLQGIPDWYNNPEHPYSNKYLGNYLYLVLAVVFPALAFVSLSAIKKEDSNNLRIKTIFVGILLIAIPFTAGSQPPTGVLYDLALKYIPGFSIFRTPFYKFGMALWFAYSYLIALGLKHLADLAQQRFFHKLSIRKVYWFALVFFILLLGIYNYPAFTGIFFNWSKNYSTMVQVPDYIFEAKKEIDNNKFSTRTLMVPQLNDGNKYIAYDWEYFSLSTIPSMLSRKSVLTNDIALIGFEPALVNTVYDQLGQSSTSPLLKYTGVDRAIVQEDFAVDESQEYQISSTKDAIYNNPDFSLSKEIGNWKFFNFNNEDIKPLFYIPQDFSYIIAESSRLQQATQIPGFDSLGDAIKYEHVSKSNQVDPLINPKKIRNLVVQAQCIDCDEDKELNIIYSPPPTIMPSNPIYFLIEFINSYRVDKLISPEEKIDFMLGNMSKEVTALDKIIINPKNRRTTKRTLSKWLKNLELIDQHFNNIEPGDRKEQYSSRIGIHYWSFLIRTQNWMDLGLEEQIRLALTEFEDRLNSYVQTSSLTSELPLASYNIGTRRYKVNIPEEGSYNLVIYNFKTEDSETLIASIDDNEYIVQKSAPQDKWYIGDTVNLNQGERIVYMPGLTKKENTYSGFEIKEKPGTSECKEIDLGDVDPEVIYELNFEYSTIFNRLTKFKLFEKNSRFPDGKEKNIRFGVNKDFLTPSLYSAGVAYTPSKLAQSAVLRICIEGNYELPTAFNLHQLTVIEKYPDYLVFLVQQKPQPEKDDYKLEFVALNQTAYLVRVSGIENSYFLNFNSRFDSKWGLRQIDSNKPDKYFIGRKKEYLDGKVVEYERQDKHILSEFTSSGNKQRSPDIMLNTFSNAWSIDPVDNSEMTFLVEYTLQSTIYKVAAVSLVSFLGLSLVGIVLFIYKRKND